MNLVVDFGNTLIKAALFKGKEMVTIKVYNSIGGLNNFTADRNDINACLISSVTNAHTSFTDLFHKKFEITEFTPNTSTPLKNQYKSVDTLGSDRLAASVGAYSLHPNKNVLVVDAGTCVKCNFTNSKNEFLGGSISPGLAMRFQSLQHFTGKLPLITFNESFDKLVGQTTEESILSGVINGILAETETMIGFYKKNYPDITVLLTGGDAAFFVKRLKSSIFAEPDLVLIGLNETLLHNS